MKPAKVSEVKAGLSKYLARVKRGEEVVITERGRPIAKIVPILPDADPGMARMRDLERRGIVQSPRRRPDPAGVLAAAADGRPRGVRPEGAARGARGGSVRFWDSSALVAALSNEPASPQVAPLMRADPGVVVWWASPVECASAVARRYREGSLAARQLEVFLRSLREAGEAWQMVVPAAAIRDAAIRLLMVHPMRAGDALQLAAALAWADGQPSGCCIVTLDDRLAAAARLEGFAVLPETR